MATKKKKKSKKKWVKGALKVKRRRKGYRAAPGHRHRKSVRVEAAHKGALHRYLGVPAGEKIPVSLLRKAQKKILREAYADRMDSVTAHRHLRQIQFALTARKFKHAKRKKGYARRR